MGGFEFLRQLSGRRIVCHSGVPCFRWMLPVCLLMKWGYHIWNVGIIPQISRVRLNGGMVWDVVVGYDLYAMSYAEICG